MSLGNDSNGTTMLVQPAGYYGGNGNAFGDGGFGGIWGIILLLLCLGNGMWGGFGGGMLPMMMGGMGMGGFGGFELYPWLNNSQNISGGFRDQMLQSSVAGLQNAVTAGFGDVQLGIAGINQNLCQTGNGIINALNSGFNAAEIAANGRQMANMQTQFGLQSALQGGFAANAAATADLKYTVATENCADRNAAMQNTRDILEAVNAKTQVVIDKLCQLELDGVKQNAETRYAALEARYNQALADNQALRFERSQTAQNAFISQGFANEVDALYNRFQNCPVNTIPVYGSQPIFTCNRNQNPNPSPCNCGGYGVAA